MLGLGIFWSLIEDLYINANAMQLDCDSIAYGLQVDASVVSSILNDFGLFNISDDVISSDSVQRRLDDRKTRSEKASKSALKRWSKEQNNANALQSQSEPNANKEKERKEKENNNIDDVEFSKKKEVQIDPLSIESKFREIEIELKASQLLIDTVRKSNSITEEECLEYISQFISEKIVEDKVPEGYSKTKSHFMNWVRKRHEGNLSKSASSPKTGPVPSQFRMQKI